MSTRDSSVPFNGLAVAACSIFTAAGIGVLGYHLGLKKADEFCRSNVMRAPSVGNGEDVREKNRKNLVDVRIAGINPLIPPACLLEEIASTEKTSETVFGGRQAVANVIHGLDDRLVVVVGPCSIHDPQAALQYANRLKSIRVKLQDDLIIIMRVYFEKPRTTVGWKGLINDPDLDGSFNINKGLRTARELLKSINEMGLPTGCEFLDTMSPQFICDLVSWGAIGARTSESQIHRELTSGLSMPIGFKNGTGGSLQLAADAVVSAQHSHCFLSVSSQGLAAIVKTTGNDCCHVILRGGSNGPNYEKESIDKMSSLLQKSCVPVKIMIDCSHGNSRKIHTNQPIVCQNISHQISEGDDRIMGVMIESNIVEGAQKLVPGKKLVYGQSITDACIGWETTVEVLNGLAKAVQIRRQKRQEKKRQ